LEGADKLRSRKVRQALDLKEGDGLAFIIEENQVILQPISQTLLDLRQCSGGRSAGFRKSAKK
jgi:bifunctional DNA-binding transcriptional regulator/antitoxin component of YhaV-PrlF toxin-antitoxin module